MIRSMNADSLVDASPLWVQTWPGIIVFGTARLLRAATFVALLVNAVTVVRRCRPDAWRLIAASPAIYVAWNACALATNLIVASTRGAEELASASFILLFIDDIATAVSIGLMAIGVARLARPSAAT
jgi:hypothetical protein